MKKIALALILTVTGCGNESAPELKKLNETKSIEKTIYGKSLENTVFSEIPTEETGKNKFFLYYETEPERWGYLKDETGKTIKVKGFNYDFSEGKYEIERKD